MALPLIAMAIAGGVRMATPAVAKYLAKRGVKKASKAAIQKNPNAPKINMSQARKAVQNKNTVNRPTPANVKYQRNPDGSIKLKGGKPVLKGAKPKVSKPKTDKSKSKTKTTKSSAFGSPGQKAIAGGAGFTATAVGLGSGSKSKKETAPRPKIKPVIGDDTPRGSDAKPAVKKQERPKSSKGRGKMAGNKGFETMKEYFVDDMSGRKSRVKTPFGTITIDSSQKGMFGDTEKYGDGAMEIYDDPVNMIVNKSKGGTVKRRMGGKVRGYGKALRGY